MVNAVRNEMFKILKQKKLYIFMGIVLIFAVLVGLQDVLLRNIPDAPTTKISGQALPIKVLGDSIKGILPLFIILLLSDIITDEYKSGTFKLMLTRQISRREFLTSKICGLAISTTLLLVWMLITSYLIGALVYGLSGGFQFYTIAMSGFKGFLATLAAYGLALLPLMVFGAVVLLISLLLTSAGSVIGLSLIILVASSLVIQFVEFLQPAMLITHFSIYMLPLGVIPEKEWLLSMAVLLIYAVVFYGASFKLFEKRDILV